MAHPTEFATYQVYQTYHKQVHTSDETVTYQHFGAVSRTSPLEQTALLTGYMTQMINSLQQELDTLGDSWLLRAIIAHELPEVHVLDFSAVAWVYSAIFCPEVTPVPDSRTIPFTSRFTQAAGGLRYADRKARSTTLDLRATDELQPLCQALLMHAGQHRLHEQLHALTEEKNALNSTIHELRDQVFGLERELASLRSAEDNASPSCDK